MSTAIDRDGRKWINTAVALCAIVGGFIIYKFFVQLNIWFALETKVPYFNWVSQGLSMVTALGAFLYIINNKETSSYLEDIYSELRKIVFPDRELTNKQTIIVMIGITVIGFVLGFFDYIASTLLSLLS